MQGILVRHCERNYERNTAEFCGISAEISVDIGEFMEFRERRVDAAEISTIIILLDLICFRENIH